MPIMIPIIPITGANWMLTLLVGWTVVLVLIGVGVIVDIISPVTVYSSGVR